MAAVLDGFETFGSPALPMAELAHVYCDFEFAKKEKCPRPGGGKFTCPVSGRLYRGSGQGFQTLRLGERLRSRSFRRAVVVTL